MFNFFKKKHKCNFKILGWEQGNWYEKNGAEFAKSYGYHFCEECRKYSISAFKDEKNMKVTGTVPDEVEEVYEWLIIKVHPINGFGYPNNKTIKSQKINKLTINNLRDISSYLEDVIDFSNYTRVQIKDYINGYNNTKKNR